MNAKTLFIIALIALPASILLAYAMGSPPEDWKNLDYTQANLSELKSDFSGYTGDLSFKTGYGWIDPHFVFEIPT